MIEQATPEVLHLLRQAVLDQVKNGDPPEAAATLERLQREGMTKEEAIRWISAALLQEMSIMIRDKRVYDHDSYAAALNRLSGLIDR